MGQSQSNIANLDKDLKNNEEIMFEKKVVLLIVRPIYIINEDEFEQNLATGNDALDLSIDEKIKKCENYLQNLVLNNLKYNTLAIVIKDQKIYLTIEKINKSTFEITDCESIRNFFDNYNHNSKKLTIMNEVEADTSPFFEQLGDIKLGFIVEQLDYM